MFCENNLILLSIFSFFCSWFFSLLVYFLPLFPYFSLFPPLNNRLGFLRKQPLFFFFFPFSPSFSVLFFFFSVSYVFSFSSFFFSPPFLRPFILILRLVSSYFFSFSLSLSSSFSFVSCLLLLLLIFLLVKESCVMFTPDLSYFSLPSFSSIPPHVRE